MVTTRKPAAKAKRGRSTPPAKRGAFRAAGRGRPAASSRDRGTASERQLQAELDLLHVVQQALATKLDYQAIVDIVGDKIGEIFDAQMVTIGRYDHDRGL